MKLMRRLCATTALGALTLHLAVPVGAQEHSSTLPPSIRVSSEAVVTAKPDRAQLDIGVMTQASQSQAAATQNAKDLDAVLKALRKLLGADSDIRTISYSLQPNYQYSPQGGPPTITGYTATNVLRVTLDDLTKVGSVIDTASQAGANQIQRVQFTLKDEQAPRSAALKEAATKARSQAEALAAALGVKTTRILSAVESSPIVYPMQDVQFARAEMAASTPVQPGMIEVRATVTLTVEIEPR